MDLDAMQRVEWYQEVRRREATVGDRMAAKAAAAVREQEARLLKQAKAQHRATMKGLMRRRKFRLLLAYVLLPHGWHAVNLGKREETRLAKLHAGLSFSVREHTQFQMTTGMRSDIRSEAK